MRKIMAAGAWLLFLMAWTGDGAVLAGKAKPKDEPRGKVVTEAQVREKLKYMDMPGNAKFSALGWFETALPPNDEIKAVVARKMIVLLMDNDNSVVKGGAARAMPNWATEEIAPKLMTVAGGAGNAGFAIIALGNLKYTKAIPLIARLLEANRQRTYCAGALVKMGPAAEPAVIKILNTKKEPAVKEACRILSQIGTSASLPELEKLSKGKNKNVIFYADNAIATIKEREEAGGTK